MIERLTCHAVSPGPARVGSPRPSHPAPVTAARPTVMASADASPRLAKQATSPALGPPARTPRTLPAEQGECRCVVAMGLDDVHRSFREAAARPAAETRSRTRRRCRRPIAAPAQFGCVPPRRFLYGAHRSGGVVQTCATLATAQAVVDMPRSGAARPIERAWRGDPTGLASRDRCHIDYLKRLLSPPARRCA